MSSDDPLMNNLPDALVALVRDISSHPEEVVSFITGFVDAAGMVTRISWLKPNEDPNNLFGAVEKLNDWREDTLLDPLWVTEERKLDMEDYVLERMKELLERADALGMDRTELLNALRDPGEEITEVMVH